MKILRRVAGFTAHRPLHLVACDCGYVFVTCRYPKSIRKQRNCQACRSRTQRSQQSGRFVVAA